MIGRFIATRLVPRRTAPIQKTGCSPSNSCSSSAVAKTTGQELTRDELKNQEEFVNWGISAQEPHLTFKKSIKPIDALHIIRISSGPKQTSGLSDAKIEYFLAQGDSNLFIAINAATKKFSEIRTEYPELVAMDEGRAVSTVQSDYLNFYMADTVNPFIPLAARGPWIVTLHGAVIHDSGGYGMLGFGQEPDEVVKALKQPQVMANIMTANLSQKRFIDALQREIGHSRRSSVASNNGRCLFDRFLCMNSGSEAMSVASRISDAHAKRMINPVPGSAPNTRHAGKRCVHLALERGFHGRTYVPGSFSDSSRHLYEQSLASYSRLRGSLWTVPANDTEALQSLFAYAESQGVFIESMIIEPVQGEGSPGVGITREFYDEARRLTHQNDSFLIVDSIQAGLRARGTLSIVDYPGFEDCEPPDMETWSKALNAGQFPLSVLGLTNRAAEEYIVGSYGNTMTSNPRALDVACAVLNMVAPAVRQNIREQGQKFVQDLLLLQEKFPDLIVDVHGTGLLFCAELNPKYVQAAGPDSAETRCRLRGMNIIHGGKNAIRFTPHFLITDAERELMIDTLEDVLEDVTKGRLLK